MVTTFDLPRFTRAAIAAFAATLLGIAACASVPPLSAVRPPPATATVPPSRTPPPAPAVPEAPASAAATTTPLAPPPGVIVSAAPVPAPVRPIDSVDAPARTPGEGIALVLPLESPIYAHAADAVRTGFLAAADRAGARSRVTVIAHGDDGVLAAMEAARRANVALVVGPLTRDDVKTVLAMSPERPRMLALNQSEDGVALPDDVYALTLSVESDAALLAKVAQADGVRSVAMVVSTGSLQQRFAAAFAAEWRRSGAAPPREYHFDPSPDMLALLRGELSARPADAVLLSVDSDQASLAKSFLPPVPVYAVSQIADDLPTPISHDLDRVRYIEIPWLADPYSPGLAGVPHPNYSNAVLDRLYALGLDAFAVAQMLSEPVPPQRIELDGATGHLSLSGSRTFARQGRLMEIRDGRAQLFSSQ
jgi:hypothetical protein